MNDRWQIDAGQRARVIVFCSGGSCVLVHENAHVLGSRKTRPSEGYAAVCPCRASGLFPPWLLANTNCNILAAPHTTELAEKWGRRIRNLIAEWSATLGIALASDSQAAGRWALTSGTAPASGLA